MGRQVLREWRWGGLGVIHCSPQSRFGRQLLKRTSATRIGYARVAKAEENEEHGAPSVSGISWCICVVLRSEVVPYRHRGTKQTARHAPSVWFSGSQQQALAPVFEAHVLNRGHPPPPPL